MTLPQTLFSVALGVGAVLWLYVAVTVVQANM